MEAEIIHTHIQPKAIVRIRLATRYVCVQLLLPLISPFKMNRLHHYCIDPTTAHWRRSKWKLSPESISPSPRNKSGFCIARHFTLSAMQCVWLSPDVKELMSWIACLIREGHTERAKERECSFALGEFETRASECPGFLLTSTWLRTEIRADGKILFVRVSSYVLKGRTNEQCILRK